MDFKTLLRLLEPRSAEAKINWQPVSDAPYNTPDIRLIANMLSGAQPVSVPDAGVDYIIDRLIKKASRVPQEVDIKWSGLPTAHGTYQQGGSGTMDQIKIQPGGYVHERPHARETLGHELLHFLQSIDTKHPDDTSVARQEAVIAAMLSPNIDKKTIMRDEVQKRLPTLSPDSEAFKQFIDRTAAAYDRVFADERHQLTEMPEGMSLSKAASSPVSVWPTLLRFLGIR